MLDINRRKLMGMASRARARRRAQQTAAAAVSAALFKRHQRQRERDARIVVMELLKEVEGIVHRVAKSGAGGVALRILHTTSDSHLYIPPASIFAFTMAEKAFIEVLSRRLMVRPFRSLHPQISFDRCVPGENYTDEYYGGSAWCTMTMTWEDNVPSERIQQLGFNERVRELWESLATSRKNAA